MSKHKKESMNLHNIIQILKSDLINEMTHMMFYLRNSASLKGLHRQEIRELFLEEAASEMKHVQQFQDMIVGLGGNIAGLMPKEVPSYQCPSKAVRHAYNMEIEVVRNYVDRISQSQELGGVDGQFLEIFLEEQILHSRTDADNLKLLCLEE